MAHELRANGVDERYCTGNAKSYEKFVAWAKTVPYTLRNPLSLDSFGPRPLLRN